MEVDYLHDKTHVHLGQQRKLQKFGPVHEPRNVQEHIKGFHDIRIMSHWDKTNVEKKNTSCPNLGTAFFSNP